MDGGMPIVTTEEDRVLFLRESDVIWRIGGADVMGELCLDTFQWISR
jgi:hypothetical protein